MDFILLHFHLKIPADEQIQHKENKTDEWREANKAMSVYITVVCTIVTWLSLDPLLPLSSPVLHLISLLKNTQCGFFQTVEYLGAEVLQGCPTAPLITDLE